MLLNNCLLDLGRGSSTQGIDESMMAFLRYSSGECKFDGSVMLMPSFEALFGKWLLRMSDLAHG